MKAVRTMGWRLSVWSVAMSATVATAAGTWSGSTQEGVLTAHEGTGVMEVHLMPELPVGWQIVPPAFQRGEVLTLPFDASFRVDSSGAEPILVGGDLFTGGPGVTIINPNSEAMDLSDLGIAFDEAGGKMGVGSAHGRAVFELVAPTLKFVGDDHLIVEALLVLDGRMSQELGITEASGAMVGVVTIEATDLVRSAVLPDEPFPPANGAAGGAIGPDVTVLFTNGIDKYGAVGGITGYAIGTTSCNRGDVVGDWYDCNNSNNPQCADHPVIAQNMYRYEDGKFEQIGMSWLKHGFCAVNESGCGSCQTTSCDTLGIGCADTYWAGLNGAQSGLGPRSEINATTGEFPYPYLLAWGQSGNAIYKRLQIHNSDLDPALHPGASYFTEGHYITTDEQPWGNDNNNASYRRVNVGSFTGGGYNLSHSAPTQESVSGIEAWKVEDPLVDITAYDIPNDGRMLLGYRVTDIGGGMWHYEYALFNMNSDRSGQSFSVPLPPDTVVANVGFHDAEYHSGEPYTNTDWQVTQDSSSLTWATETFDQNPNANALRFSTLYNFRFDADKPPFRGEVALGLFKPGTPASFNLTPNVPAPDCNGNGVADISDISSGGSTDANGNGIPDECEAMIPLMTAEGSRYLSVELVGTADSFALYFTGDSEDTAVACVGAYVQADGTLDASALFRTTTEWGSTVHVTGEEILPGTTYSIQVDTGTPGSPILGPPAAAQTWAWGDIDLNEIVNFTDINLVVQGFQGDFTNVSLENVDLDPCVPNGVINFADINKDVQAFQGIPYAAATGCAVPCP